MPKQSKEDKIRELEEINKKLLESINHLSKREKELVDAEEGTFLRSPTYLQLQAERDFFKNLSDLNEINLAAQKKRTLVLDDKARQIYEDNRQLTARNGDAEYFIGITNNSHEAREYMQMQEKIFELEAKVDQQAESIRERDAEIERLQKQLAEMTVRQERESMKQDSAEQATKATETIEDVREVATSQTAEGHTGEEPDAGGKMPHPRRHSR